MKAILISIRPQWVEKILNRIKKDEVRKGTALYKAINKLIAEQGVAPMLIYCTKTGYLHLENNGKWSYSRNQKYTYVRTGKVVARFNATAEEITPFEEYESPFGMAYKLTEDKILCCQKAQLTYDEYNHYLKGEKGTDIHITKLEIFDRPKEISEFHKANVDIKKCDTSYCDDYYTCGKCEHSKLTRAPQSWCYIEI